MTMWSLAQLESMFPWVHWREPQPVSFGERWFYGCRVCIANVGIKTREAPAAIRAGVLHETEEDAVLHIAGHE